MRIFNPIGLAALMAVPAIIIMYMLKQKHTEVKVSSLTLWEKAAASTLSKSPWQKLRKNLLMALQLIAAALIALALANPYIMGQGEGEGYVFVLDSSASMGAQDISPTRLESVKQEVYRIIDNASPASVFSVIDMGGYPYAAVSASSDKAAVKRAVEGIAPGGTAETSTAIALARAESERFGGLIYVFTDNAEIGQLAANVVPVGESGDNCGISFAAYSQGSVVAHVENYGSADEAREVSIYTADGALLDVSSVSLAQGGGADVYFDNVPEGGAVVKITPADNLPADDSYYIAGAGTQTFKALLVSDGNIFIERAAGLFEGVELYKRTTEQIEGLSGYGLYIFDGALPATLPTDGSILAINPPQASGLLETGGSYSPNGVSLYNTELTQSIGELGFSVSDAKEIKLPAWAQASAYSSGGPLIFHGYDGAERIVAFAFDLHNSDLPLKMEFPILMYNIMNYFFPALGEGVSLTSGERGEVPLAPDTVSAYITGPSGGRTDIAPPFPQLEYMADEPGYYTLTEENAAGARSERLIAVNPPASEGRIAAEAQPRLAEGGGLTAESSISLKTPLILLLLITLAAEWVVYCRGH